MKRNAIIILAISKRNTSLLFVKQLWKVQEVHPLRPQRSPNFRASELDVRLKLRWRNETFGVFDSSKNSWKFPPKDEHLSVQLVKPL